MPQFKVFVDWDNDGGLLLGDFESGTDGWTGATFGTIPPVLSRSTTRAYHGDASLLVAWHGGAGEIIQGALMGSFAVGLSYTISARVYVPSSGGRHVVAAVAGIGFGSTSSVTDAWTEVSITWTASASTHVMQLWTSGTPSAGDQTWVDLVRVTLAGEDVTSRTLDRYQTSMAYGRDTARTSAPVTPGRAALGLNNTSRDYSPDNTGSPLYGYAGPGVPLRIEATTATTAYTLFAGNLDEYTLLTRREDRAVQLTAMDLLGRLRGVKVSTQLYPSLRTGDAIHAILDAVGFTGGRDIDAGASTLRWWWLHDEDALSALSGVTRAEGPPALAYIGPSGQFIFRDRHHRLTRAASTTSQATFRGSGTEPTMQEFTYDAGWSGIVNVVEIPVTEREPAAETVVWSDANPFTLSPGESRVFTIDLDNPVTGIITPTSGSADTDIINSGGVTVTAAVSRDSGQSLRLTLSTLPSAATTVVTSVQLRAQPVIAARTFTVSGEDAASVARHGRRAYEDPPAWCNRNDAAAIVDLVLGQYAQRRPMVMMRLDSGDANTARLAQQLGRRLSDRVTIIETEAAVDGDFYIERIEHTIPAAAAMLSTTIYATQVPALPDNVFRFDVVGAGFNDGVFAPTGLDDPATMFMFNTTGQGFNDGLFAA